MQATTSILDNAELAEATLMTLMQAKTDTLISHGGKVPAAMVTYSRNWQKLVGEELRAEINDGLLKRPRGMECTVTVLGAIKDAKTAGAIWVALKTKEVAEDSDDNPDPPTMHMLFMSPEHEVVFYISGYRPDRAGDKFRAVAFDAEALRQARVASPRELPRGKCKCIELASASTALQRVHALSNIHKLEPGIAAALVANTTSASAAALASAEAAKEDPWRPLDPKDPMQQAQLARLNPGQRAALSGLRGAVSVVQGPPGTGKSSFITAACLARVPAGSRILACTATNKAIDSLVAKVGSTTLCWPSPLPLLPLPHAIPRPTPTLADPAFRRVLLCVLRSSSRLVSPRCSAWARAVPWERPRAATSCRASSPGRRASPRPNRRC
jgi:hypothetical protein